MDRSNQNKEIMRERSRGTNTSLQANFDIHREMLSELG